jgi:hypothetical protein
MNCRIARDFLFFLSWVPVLVINLNEIGRIKKIPFNLKDPDPALDEEMKLVEICRTW